MPNSDAIWSFATRCIDWSVTVPLLVVQIIAVSALAGPTARRMRAVGMAAAFLMIFTGYLGGVVIDDGTSLGARWVWGIISSVFFVIAYAVVLATVLPSLKTMSSAAERAGDRCRPLRRRRPLLRCAEQRPPPLMHDATRVGRPAESVRVAPSRRDRRTRRLRGTIRRRAGAGQGIAWRSGARLRSTGGRPSSRS